MAVDLNYGIGVEGKNLVLKTLGRVYVKVKDRKYELLFRPEDMQELIKQYLDTNNIGGDGTTSNTSDIVVVYNDQQLQYLPFPGNNKLIVNTEGKLYVTDQDQYKEIVFKFNPNSLNIETLTVSGTLSLLGTNPLVMTSSNVIANLNADMLDGHHAEDFAIKSANEQITGNWNFDNFVFNNAIGNQMLSDPTRSKVYIDFKTGTIVCQEIIANNLQEEELDEAMKSISGIGKEVWIGGEVKVVRYSIINESDIDSDVAGLEFLENVYNEEYLPQGVTDLNGDWINWDFETFWCQKIFFDTYDLDNYTYTLKNFDDPNVVNTVNQNFANTNYSIGDFQILINALKTFDTSQFTGQFIKIELSQEVNPLLLAPNIIFKDDAGHIGYIVGEYNDTIYARWLHTGSKDDINIIVGIGSLAYNGGIVFKSEDPSLSILRDVLDENSQAVYFGQLSKIDPNKSGIGMILSGSVPTNKVSDNQLTNLRNYIHTSEINIENPYIKWQQINELNEDGSGYLSHGQIRWSSNNDLVVDGSDVTNSRIDNTGITNSSFQSGSVIINTDGSGSIGDKIAFNTTTVTKNTPMGPAGGDLSGNYPNPTIKDGAITSNKLANNAVTTDKIANGAVTEAKLDSVIITRLNTIETDVDNLQSDVTTIKEDIVEINADIVDIQTQLDQIDQKIQEQLEPLVEDVENLKTTVSEQGQSITSLSTSLNNLSDTVTSHGQSITNINESITTLTDSIDSVDTNLTALTTRVATLESTVGTLNTLLENRLDGK